MRVRVAVGVAVGMALVVGMLAVVLSRSEPRPTGSNTRVAASALELSIPRGAQRCQRREFVAADTERVQVFARATGASRAHFRLTVRSESGATVTGRGSAGRRAGPVRVRIARLPRDAQDATVCIRSQNADLRLAGNLTPYRSLATGQGSGNPGEPGDVVRLDYFHEGSQSWLETLPDVAERVWLFKGPFRGPEAALAIALLLALAWAASLWLLFREAADARR